MFHHSTLTNFSGVKEPILPVLYHDYYQWVSIVLLLQAISFHLPFQLCSKNIHSYVQELTIQKYENSECDGVFNVISSKGNGIFWKIWTLECFYAAQLICQMFLLNLFSIVFGPYPAGHGLPFSFCFHKWELVCMTTFRVEEKLLEDFGVYYP
ncbi:innexin [Trichonephila clavipes]|nr:innexin [Trichonephila clavipes]